MTQNVYVNSRFKVFILDHIHVRDRGNKKVITMNVIKSDRV